MLYTQGEQSSIGPCVVAVLFLCVPTVLSVLQLTPPAPVPSPLTAPPPEAGETRRPPKKSRFKGCQGGRAGLMKERTGEVGVSVSVSQVSLGCRLEEEVREGDLRQDIV